MTIETPSLNMAEASISLGHLKHNIREIKQCVGTGVRIMGIVKANAYGHNMQKVAETLEAEGISDFGVANIHGAIELKTGGALKKPANILSFSSPIIQQIEYYLHHQIDMTLCDANIMKAASAIAEKHNKKIGVHLKVDTGMGRLGLPPLQALELLRETERQPGLELKGVYTHFAESANDDFTRRQFKEFKTMTDAYETASGKTLCKHAASSGTLLNNPEMRLDMVRPGILLYGYKPYPALPSSITVRPVMQFEAKVIFIKTVAKDATISYNRTWKAARPVKIATISAGYADGYHRALSNHATVFINGKSFQQVGTVTMDQFMVDLGTESDVKIGDRAILFGWEGPCLEELAGSIGSISYELLCSVSSRVKRVFTDD